jgi:tetratricopeptide (TPR) repeat protein
MGRLNEALHHYDQCLELAPTSDDTWAKRGETYRLQLAATDHRSDKQEWATLVDESRRCYVKALDINPNNVFAQLGRDRLEHDVASASLSETFIEEFTPELAAAIKTVAAAMETMGPTRRVGSDQVAKQELESKYGLSAGEYGLWTQIRTVGVDYGGLRAATAGVPMGGDGQPVPLYTFPAIEFLDQLVMDDKTVLEFGSGQSTLFYSRRVKHVVALENNMQWVTKVRKNMLDQDARNVEVVDASLGKDSATWRGAYEWVGNMADALTGSRWADAKFDIIAVDGLGNRLLMAEAALERLAPSGLIVLDNTGWYPTTARLLR